MSEDCCKIVTVFVISLVFIIMWPSFYVYGQESSSKTINAAIKLSVCGDDVIEGSENCEGDNLNEESCISLGYASGDLSCDISCSFDTSDCVALTPTPTPSSTPSPTATPTPETSSSVDTPTSTPTPTTTSSVSQVPISTPTPQQLLPPTLLPFDIGGFGKIRLIDVPVVIKIWIDEWKNTLAMDLYGQSTNQDRKICDINEDARCDLKDFSILMFYIDK